MSIRHTHALQDHRRSRAGGLYFVTCCTKDRRPVLANSAGRNALLNLIKQSDLAGDTLTYAFTVMPDHLHWVMRLGDRLTLGQVMAKTKSLSRRTLSFTGLEWQRNYFEHEVRSDESTEDYSLYVFLNPYRAALLASDQRWPGWWSGRSQELQFWALLHAGETPPPEWLDFPVPVDLQVGE